MCGILAILDIDPFRCNAAELRRQAVAQWRKLRHRGPDWSGVYSDDHAILVHERLSIVDVAKHRNGETGEVRMNFVDSYTRFEDRVENHPGIPEGVE